MIKRANEMKRTVKTNMRGGDGEVLVTDLLNAGEYQGKSRMVATLTLVPGASIGVHIHEGEEEIFYVMEGVAAYDDNGEAKELYAGDACICLGGQKHSIANRSEQVLKVFAVILTY